MHKILTVLSLLLLGGCASIPQWSDNPRDCSFPELEEGWNKDVVTGIQKFYKRKYVCVEQPEVVKLPSYIELLMLPPADERPVVAVYGFADKTGQRKARDGIADFSTAVTQGGTEMLIDALKTAGGGTWFRVVERQGLDNLVRERQLIRSARQEFAGPEGPQSVTPLLFAGIMIEGGIISYESNFITGGIGAFSEGLGIGKQYRKDVVTVSLRMISSQTGQVLLSTTVSKTILSIGSSSTYFRYLDLETNPELFEAEFGVTNNERSSIAVRCAISAAIVDLINQGHEKGLW